MMDRPLSAASSGTAPSTTSGPIPGHKRTGSSIKIPTRTASTSSNTASLFLTNLRLLDLDVSSDWPGITPSSLNSAHDARTRIKHVEYALYHLFRLYDPIASADKLKVFYPPLEPLQSVNLRAGLFRCLNELKKNGVLARETVLRKTMLDECQGERFWEVCLTFSAVVVRKVLREKESSIRGRTGRFRAVAEDVGSAPGVTKEQRESMLPLAIAHKAALTNVLKRKEQQRASYARLHGVLADKESELLQRKHQSLASAKSKNVAPEKLNNVEATVHKNWIGSADLKEALIEGDTCPQGDGILLQSFDRLWNDGRGIERQESPGVEIGLLQSLGTRANEQSARLKRWQNFYDRLIASKPVPTKSSRPASQVQKPGLTFNKHRDISLADSSDDEEAPETRERPQPRNESSTRYDDILTAMRNELRKNTFAHRNQRPSASPVQRSSIQPVKRSQTQPLAPVRKLSVVIDMPPGGPTAHHSRSPSQTLVPLRSPMGRRIASRSRSYEKPKVDGMREVIPLKTELFSPLRDPRRSSLSPLSATIQLPSPQEVAEDLHDVEINGDKISQGETDSDLAIEDGIRSPASPRDSGLGMNADGLPKDASDNSSESAVASDAESKVPYQVSQKPPVRQSLAERTRKSMAFGSFDNAERESLADRSEFAKNPDIPGVNEELEGSLADEDQLADRRASLSDRTRQSISHAPQAIPAPRSKKSSHARSRTSTYPVNQFETPKKVRRSTVGIQEEAEQEFRKVTPMETLMSPDAEYDSVFKSRPKIALSPVLSPRTERESLNALALDGVNRARPGADERE